MSEQEARAIKENTIKLSDIENKNGFLYRIAKANLEAYGFYFCTLSGKKTEVLNA